MLQDESIVEANIGVLATALASGTITTVELVSKCLLRISKYDCRNTSLNAVPLLNNDVFAEAAAADDRRATDATRGPLDGIPFTVKDSYKVKGMTVANGSEAFKDLIANEDAFLVKVLRDAGAVLIGKTNMCPMAYGGMLRGAYGRAESPYNSEYLAAAFGSGSSNGSGVSTAASFAAFGLGGETVSSGRSPASNNGLITYTPSRGLISGQGTWPLYPTCDVIISHTRSMDDLLVLLGVITAENHLVGGDFWMDQPFVPQPLPRKVSEQMSAKGYVSVKNDNHLRGKRVAVPRMYITQQAQGPYISNTILPLWQQTQASLEAMGATVELIDEFPAVQVYEALQLGIAHQFVLSEVLPENWNSTERGQLIAHAWEDFLQENASQNISSLTGIAPEKMFPHLPPSDPQVKFTEPVNAVQWSKLASYVANRTPSKFQGLSPLYDVPRLGQAVKALESMRTELFEDWLNSHRYDYVAFPAVGDVARADADIDSDSAEHAWANGVKYSHGNRALRHLGIPSVTVPMGTLEPQQMPIGLTILGRAYDDFNILKAAYHFEQMTQKRVAPPLTPPLASDKIPAQQDATRAPMPKLDVASCSITAMAEDDVKVVIEGNLSIDDDATQVNRTFEPQFEIFIDGSQVEASNIKISTPQKEESQTVVHFSCACTTARPPEQDDRNKVVGKIARDSTMIMILGRDGIRGKPSGYLKLVHASDL